MTINELAAQANFYFDMATATGKQCYQDKYNEIMADTITQTAHSVDARIVCGIRSRRLSLAERVGDGFPVSIATTDYLNGLIREYNKQAASK